jgi:hypothetical protein
MAARIAARANRAFRGPTAGNTHEVAQRAAPDARIVYVDNDPMVMVHARALLTSTPSGETRYIEDDLRNPSQILTPELKASWDESLRTGRSDVHPRTRAEFDQFFAGLEVVAPGVVAVSQWRPDPAAEEHATPVEASIFGAVGRKL